MRFAGLARWVGEVSPTECGGLIDLLRRAVGEPELMAATTKDELARFAAALSMGDTGLLTALRHRRGFGSAFRGMLRTTSRASLDCEPWLRVMVSNRPCQGSTDQSARRAPVPFRTAVPVLRLPRRTRTVITLARFCRLSGTCTRRARSDPLGQQSAPSDVQLG
jgi:hypothetical protein